MELLIALSCGGDSLVTVAVAVPAPGADRPLSEQVGLSVRVSQILSPLSTGSSVGSALGRVMATAGMVVCDSDGAPGEGLIDLHVELKRKATAPASVRSLRAVRL
jgi:hypothetical protein